MYTFNFAEVGSCATGNNPGEFLLAGPSWRGGSIVTSGRRLGAIAIDPYTSHPLRLWCGSSYAIVRVNHSGAERARFKEFEIAP